MLIKCLPVGHLMTNCYIVTDETTLECAVIDPGDESNTILYYLEDNHLTCRAILLTHGHYDHTGAVATLMETLPPMTNCASEMIPDTGRNMRSAWRRASG